MTVKELIDELKEFNPKATIHIATRNGEIDLLSVYDSANRKAVWFDVGPDRTEKEIKTFLKV